ncbi:hypothetical protein [Streptomyces xiaopingdaonensis]|uniref:SCO2583 family membrane protein n=1 Tax=Streptomyces xiaopingdaonensis TaxID=1565415 RepID=UPI0002F339FA|nr:hypothetical protein [Streptomyces xiaopingdaonensis]
MSGREDPPDGAPESGGPTGGDEEYGALVFDESFVQAARLQEYSAQERIADDSHAAVRSRPAAERKTGLTFSKQGVLLCLLIAMAFGTAIYMGIRNPYHSPPQPAAEPMRISLLPLAPRDAVPGAEAEDLFANSPAAEFRSGADGVTLPPARRSEHFSESEVLTALTSAKDYVVESSLDPEVLTGGAARPVRLLLDPGQQRQFDESLESPRNDGSYAATGWMVRFDPEKTALADPRVRVDGTLDVKEAGPAALEVTADHVFAYAVRPAGDGAEEAASLFTVRREVRFHFTREDLRDHQLSVRQVSMRAGPLPCSADPSDTLVPLLAGEKAKEDGPAGTNPYADGRSAVPTCGALAANAQPSPRNPSP